MKRLIFTLLALSVLQNPAALRAQTEDTPAAPTAVTHKVFIGCSSCNSGACTLAGFAF